MNQVITANMGLVLNQNMRDEDARYFYTAQLETRPEIDDVICQLLDGSVLKEALIFIDNVRANRMKIKWTSVNVWSVYYRAKHICDIMLEYGSWSVSHVNEYLNSQDGYVPYSTESKKWLVAKLKDAITGSQKNYQKS